MAKKETDDLMYNRILLAANLYYKNHFSQQEIAKRFTSLGFKTFIKGFGTWYCKNYD